MLSSEVFEMVSASICVFQSNLCVSKQSVCFRAPQSHSTNAKELPVIHLDVCFCGRPLPFGQCPLLWFLRVM